MVREGDALLIVDVQRDFLPGGTLAVTGGDEVIPVLNRYLRLFVRAGLPVVATRDWHPPDHCSFQAEGGIWPRHCVAGTPGAEIDPRLELPEGVRVVDKATTTHQDMYSGFEGTGLADWLRSSGVSRLYIGGLATDYCVLNTTKDAREAGFQVCLLTDAVRAVDARAGDGERAIRDMVSHGAEPVTVDDLHSAA